MKSLIDARLWNERQRRSTTYAALVILLSTLVSCTPQSEQTLSAKPTAEADSDEKLLDAEHDPFAHDRDLMVSGHMASRDIVNQRVLDTIGHVPRHEFVPANLQSRAYEDSPLPIGQGQTISQPYIVALMTQLVDPQPHHKALDVGTGSGYQAAVLAELVKEVFSIEIVESLANSARTRLQKLGYENIQVRHGDGYAGWKEEAPFDVIVVAAAPDHIPPALIDQLAPGGKLVIPVGDFWQTLVVVEKNQDGTIDRRNIAPVRFVPMTGDAER